VVSNRRKRLVLTERSSPHAIVYSSNNKEYTIISFFKRIVAGAKYLAKITIHTLNYWFKKSRLRIENTSNKNKAATFQYGSLKENEPKISIVFHAYYLDLAKEIFVWIKEFASKVELPVNLIVTTPEENIVEISTLAESPHYQTEVIGVENIGRDIWPFLQVCQSGKIAKSALVLKIHTKSPRQLNNQVQLDIKSVKELLNPLLVSELLENTNQSDLFLATYKRYIGKTSNWGRNLSNYFNLLSKLQIKAPPRKLRFASGTIFWTTGAFTTLLGNLNLERGDFKGEPSPDDGAAEHALERFFGMIAMDNDGVIPLEKLVMGGNSENRNSRNQRDSS
jgi:lipopolysaccharide biosynthesis protein